MRGVLFIAGSNPIPGDPNRVSQSYLHFHFSRLLVLSLTSRRLFAEIPLTMDEFVIAGSAKASLCSPMMLPRVALVDPELTYALPPAVIASTGLDAQTRLIEPHVSAHTAASGPGTLRRNCAPADGPRESNRGGRRHMGARALR